MPDYYAAALLFESTSPAAGHRPLYEETITVLRAGSLEDDLTDGGDVFTRHFRDYDAYQAFEPLPSGEEL